MRKGKRYLKGWRLYVMCLPAVLYYLLFVYKPMPSIIIAFKNFSMRLGIWESEWVGMANFQRLFQSYWFPIILKNTLTLSLLALLILQCGNLLSVGYEKVYLLQNATNLSASEVISTYVYKTGLTQSDFSFATAVGLFNSVVNTVILVCANTISKVTARTSLF